MIHQVTALTMVMAGLAAPAARDTTPPEVHSITFSRESVVVSGLQNKLLVVSARLTDDTAVGEEPFFPGQEFRPAVQVGGRWVALSRATGTAQDGVWTGGVAVTSDWVGGAVEPERILVRDTARNELDIDPATVIEVPSVQITSTNKPVLTLTFSPQPAVVNGNLTRTVRVTDRESGHPLPGVPISLGYDNFCGEGDARSPDGRTNDSGVYSSTSSGVTSDAGSCAWIVGDAVPEQPGTIIAPVYVFPVYRWSVAARPARSSAPAGSNVTVTGTLAPSGCNLEVQLQRRYPDGNWRTVNRATAANCTDFSVVATPPSVATHSYRVFAPARSDRVSATSPIFTIRGT